MTTRRRRIFALIAISLFAGLAALTLWASSLQRVTFGEHWEAVRPNSRLRWELRDYAAPLRASFKNRPIEVDVLSYFPQARDSAPNPLLWVKVHPRAITVLWHPPQVERFRWWGMEWVPKEDPMRRGPPQKPRRTKPTAADRAARAVRNALEERLEEYAALVAEERSLMRRMWKAHLQLRRDGGLDLAPLPSDWLDPGGSFEERAQRLTTHALLLEELGERVAQGEVVAIPQPLRRVVTAEPPPLDHARLPDFATEAWSALWEGNPRSEEFSISATTRGRRVWVRSELEPIASLVALQPADTFASRLAEAVETAIASSGNEESRALLRSERRRLEIEYGGGITPIEITGARTEEALETLQALERVLKMRSSPSLSEKPVRAIHISGEPTAQGGWQHEGQLPRRAIQSSVLTIPLGAEWLEIRDWLPELGRY